MHPGYSYTPGVPEFCYVKSARSGKYYTPTLGFLGNLVERKLKNMGQEAKISLDKVLVKTPKPSETGKVSCPTCGEFDCWGHDDAGRSADFGLAAQLRLLTGFTVTAQRPQPATSRVFVTSGGLIFRDDD